MKKTAKTNVIVDGGEMGERIRNFAWEKTSLGPISDWPQSLLTAVNILLQSPVPLVMLWGEDGIMLYNDAYSVFAGRRHPFLLGSKVVEGWPEVADFNRNVMKNGLAGKTLSYKDQRLTLYRNNVPEDVWMDLNYSPIMDERGKPGGVLAIVVETTKRVLAEQKQKKAEDELQLERDRLRETNRTLGTIIKSSPLAIYVMGADTKIMLWNKAAEQIFGFTEKEVKGKRLPIIQKEKKEEHEHLIGILQSGQAFTRDVIRQRKDGSLVDLIVSANPIMDEGGRLRTIIAIAADITERKKLERQKDEFLGIASHELKTPVTSIKAYGQVLQRMFQKEGNQKAVAQLEKMDGQINKLTMLISDLLDVTKIQSGKLVMQEDDFVFDDLVREITEELQRTTEKHRLITKLSAGSIIYGDRERIGQVLTNFLTNAIKYSPYADKILITSKIDAKNTILSVQDFGIGIPKNNQQRVFEQFYRVSSDKQHTFPGLGLGLYISSEIITRHGGKIWVESVQGKGSTFFFKLPLQREKHKNTPTDLDEELMKHE